MVCVCITCTYSLALDVCVGRWYEGQLLQQLLADVLTNTQDAVSHFPVQIKQQMSNTHGSIVSIVSINKTCSDLPAPARFCTCTTGLQLAE